MSRPTELFPAGAPRSDQEAKEFKDVIVARALSSPLPAQYKAVDYVDDILRRITEKSIGLLQADSILAAIAVVYAAQAPEPSAIHLSRIALILALFSCTLLAANLGLAWPRSSTVYADPDAEFDLSMNLCRVRGRRFTLALRVSIFAFIVELAGATASFLHGHLARLNAKVPLPICSRSRLSELTLLFVIDCDR